MTRSIVAGVFVAVLMTSACVSYKKDADTAAALPSVDTVKPAAASPMPDSVAADSQPQAPATQHGATTKAGAKTGTKARSDTTKILGRDSVIMPKRSGGLPVKKDTSPPR